MARKYHHNFKCGNAARVWKDNAHVPKSWRDTGQRERAFRAGINVEVSPINGEVFAAWVYVADKKEFWFWMPGARWQSIRPIPPEQLGQWLLPPADAIPLEVAGCGRGWGMYADMMIAAADKLAADTAKH